MFPKVGFENRDRSALFVKESDALSVLSELQRVAAFRASCGSGKTEAATQLAKGFLHQFPDGLIIIVTPRITLAENIVKRFTETTGISFFAYNDPLVPRRPDPNGKIRHVVVQVESLYRFSSLYLDNHDHPVCVIVDELIAVLTQLASTYTQGGPETKVCVGRNGQTDEALMKSTREKFRGQMGDASSRHAANVRTFFAILRAKNNRVAVFDAFLSLFAVSILRDLVGERNLKIYEYTRRPEKRSVVFVKQAKGRSSEEKCEPLLVLLVQMIRDGMNIYMFCSSKKMVCSVKTRLRSTFGPGFEIFLATGDETTDALTDVDITWKKFRVVLTTSKVTVGVNFSVRNHFDAIFCYVMATCRNRVRDVFQALFRVRHPRTQTIFFMLDQYVHPEVMGELAGPTEQDAELLVLTTCNDKEPPIDVEMGPEDSVAVAFAKPGRNIHLHRMRHVILNLRKSSPEDADILTRIFIRDEFETAVSTLFSEGQIETFMESCGFVSAPLTPSSGKRSLSNQDEESENDDYGFLEVTDFRLHSKPPWQTSPPLPRKKK